MRINSSNEWGRLKSVVVGSATNANWPSDDPVFAEEAKKTTWTATPVPGGPVPQWIIDEANEDLEILADTLTKLKISVYRPKDLDFVKLGGMYNYCPRDRLIIAGTTVIVPNMMYPCRNMEEVALDAVLDAAEHYIYMPRDQGMIMDAANVCRMNDRWLFLESPSGNRLAYEWLCAKLPDIQIDLVNFYSGVHIDSTITPLREGFFEWRRAGHAAALELLKDRRLFHAQSNVERHADEKDRDQEGHAPAPFFERFRAEHVLHDQNYDER